MSDEFQWLEKLPVLECPSKNGKTKIWFAEIYYNDSTKHANAVINHGYMDGKIQSDERLYTLGKNIGRANETTPLQQCKQEMKRKWTDKMEKEGYKLLKVEQDVVEQVTPLTTPSTVFYPMLAQTFDPASIGNKKKKSVITFPCFVQPKLDGLRCVIYYDAATSTIMTQSRTGTIFENLTQVKMALSGFFRENPSIVLDGELYSTMIPFEELVGLIKKKKVNQDDMTRINNCVQYHVYDMFDYANPEMTFEQRNSFLSTNHQILFGSSSSPSLYILQVATHLVNTIDEFKEYFGKFVENGYEGIMLRNMGGNYVQNNRSHDLQKYKEFFESEFKIVGFKEGDGRDKGTVIWICEIPQEPYTQFSVRPKGTIEYRKDLFKNAYKYVNKMLTVIYQELSVYNVPRFPVGKAIREDY